MFSFKRYHGYQSTIDKDIHSKVENNNTSRKRHKRPKIEMGMGRLYRELTKEHNNGTRGDQKTSKGKNTLIPHRKVRHTTLGGNAYSIILPQVSKGDQEFTDLPQILADTSVER